jgi:hypothetical protein
MFSKNRITLRRAARVLEEWMNRVAFWAGLVAALIGVSTAAAAEVPVPQNFGQAMHWYERAAEAGNVEAQFYLGVMYETGVRGNNDTASAAKWYRKAAEQGHVQAQTRLGVLYYQGRGVPADFAEAARWYAKAADGGSPRAQYNLALMYERGQGVPVNAAMAASLYEKASDGGTAQARLSLATLYARGEGVKRDPQRALMWLDMAAASGLRISDAVRQGLLDELSPAQKAEAKRLADERLAKSADPQRPNS